MISANCHPVQKSIAPRSISSRKAISTSHIQMEINATAIQQAHYSPASPWNSPRTTAAREVAEILNIARSAGPPEILTSRTCQKSLLLAQFVVLRFHPNHDFPQNFRHDGRPSGGLVQYKNFIVRAHIETASCSYVKLTGPSSLFVIHSLLLGQKCEKTHDLAQPMVTTRELPVGPAGKQFRRESASHNLKRK